MLGAAWLKCETLWIDAMFCDSDARRWDSDARRGLTQVQGAVAQMWGTAWREALPDSDSKHHHLDARRCDSNVRCLTQMQGAAWLRREAWSDSIARSCISCPRSRHFHNCIIKNLFFRFCAKLFLVTVTRRKCVFENTTSTTKTSNIVQTCNISSSPDYFSWLEYSDNNCPPICNTWCGLATLGFILSDDNSTQIKTTTYSLFNHRNPISNFTKYPLTLSLTRKFHLSIPTAGLAAQTSIPCRFYEIYRLSQQCSVSYGTDVQSGRAISLLQSLFSMTLFPFPDALPKRRPMGLSDLLFLLWITFFSLLGVKWFQLVLPCIQFWFL